MFFFHRGVSPSNEPLLNRVPWRSKIISEIYLSGHSIIRKENLTFLELESTQNSPMDLDIIELEWISKLITIGKLEAHQPDRNKEIKSESHTVELRFGIEGFVVQLAILPEEIKKCLAADQVAVFKPSVIIKIGGKGFFIETPHGIPASEAV